MPAERPRPNAASGAARAQNEEVAGLPTTRRVFLRRVMAAGATLAAGSGALAACAGESMPSKAGSALPIATTSPGTAPTTRPVPRTSTLHLLDTPESPSGLLRIENRPGLIATDTVRTFQLATGVTVDYYQDIVDDDMWLAAEQAALSARDDLGADLLILGDRATTDLIRTHRVATIDPENVPDRSHLRRELAEVGFDPGRARSLPWTAGMAGLAWNSRQIVKPVVGVGDLFDPRHRGRVTMLADFRDGLGMVMGYQGHSPADATPATVARAAARVQAAVRAGQIARFTGNADFADLVAGRVAIAQVRSDDMAGLRAANPALRFAVPESGSTLFARNMVIPDTTHNQVAAEAWMDWIYDRPNYAAMIAQVGATGVLSGLHDDLARVDPAAAANPLIDPPTQVWARLAVWPPIDPATEAAYTATYLAAAH